MFHKLFKSKPYNVSVSTNGYVWVTTQENWKTIEIREPNDLQKINEGGKLSDELSDAQQQDIIKLVHKIQSPKTLRAVHPLSQFILALSFFLAIFWLGTGALFKLEEASKRTTTCAPSLSPDALQTEFDSKQFQIDILKEAQLSLPPESKDSTQSKAEQSGSSKALPFGYE